MAVRAHIPLPECNMAPLVTPRDDKLLQQYLNLRYKAFQEPRFPRVLYVLQASLSFDALLTFWDKDPMQTTFNGDTAFLEERLIFLESLYNYVVGDDLSALRLPSRDRLHLAFLTKQFIRATCKSLQDITLARVPASCVLEAYRLQIGEPDLQIHRLCCHLPSFTDPCLNSQGDKSRRWCFAQLGKICGDDADSLQSVKCLVSRFWQVTDPAMGMLLLECLLLRAALRRQGSGWIRSWFQPATSHKLWQETSQNMSQACLSYMQCHRMTCKLEESRRLLLRSKLKPNSHAAWSKLWAPQQTPSSSRQKSRSCFIWT